jgi:23S rRNA (uracil1939-C5)-methyltransferase
VEITVDRVGARGDGVAEWREHRLFVPQALAGDRLMVRFGARRADGWEAVPVSLIAEAPGRADPACRHFGTCGGCALQHMADDTYADWSRQVVETALARAGLTTGVEIRPLLRTPPGGRRRAVLTAAKRGSRQWLGFNERASHRLVDVAECPVLAPALADLIEPLRRLLSGWLADGQGLDVALTLLEDGVDLVLEGGPEPDLRALEALAGFAADHDLARLTRRAKPGVPVTPVSIRRDGIITFGRVPVRPAPGAFLQASREGEAALVAAAREAVAGAERVADLFAGSGTLTFPLAERSRVHAVEGDAAALGSLEGGARVAGLLNTRVTLERRDLFQDPLTVPELDRFQAIVFDPPRAGAQAQAAEIARSAVPVVCAVSCNPATFARDARALADGGYRLVWVQPVDQFLWSPHLELAALFRRG